jgi:hypothetical protein
MPEHSFPYIRSPANLHNSFHVGAQDEHKSVVDFPKIRGIENFAMPAVFSPSRMVEHETIFRGKANVMELCNAWI